MKRLREAIVHIGGEKTGTTTIQAWCANNRAGLAEHGILYPRTLGTQNHLRLAAFAVDDEVIDDTRLFLGLSDARQVQDFRDALRARLGVEIVEAGKPRVLLLSNEHLQSRLRRTAEVSRLKAFVDEFAEHATILVYLRRQDRLAMSYFSTRLKADVDEADEVFPSDLTRNDIGAYYDYDAMLRRFEAVFGQDNIRVRIFEPDRLVGGDLIEDFKAQCGLPRAAAWEPVERENLSLSEAAIAFYRAFNKKVPRFEGGKLNKLRAGINEAMAKGFAGPGPAASEAEAGAFLARFARSNAAVRDRYFPDSSASLFNQDFGAAVEAAPSNSGGETATDIAIHLWLERSRAIHTLQAENALFRYLLAGKDKRVNKKPPRLPELPSDRGLSDFILMRYAGALMDAGEPVRAVEALGPSALAETGRPALALAHGLALLRAGEAEAFEAQLQRRRREPALATSLASLREAGAATLKWPRVLALLKAGDPIQRQMYRKCLAWLEE